MSDQPTTIVPPGGSFYMTRDQERTYILAQAIIDRAIAQLGLQMGVSVALSGITRELRRHMSIEDIQAVLRGLVDTLPEAAAGDLPD